MLGIRSAVFRVPPATGAAPMVGRMRDHIRRAGRSGVDQCPASFARVRRSEKDDVYHRGPQNPPEFDDPPVSSGHEGRTTATRQMVYRGTSGLRRGERGLIRRTRSRWACSSASSLSPTSSSIPRSRRRSVRSNIHFEPPDSAHTSTCRESTDAPATTPSRVRLCAADAVSRTDNSAITVRRPYTQQMFVAPANRET